MSHRVWVRGVGSAFVAVACAAPLHAEVLISEIMYDPASDEKPPAKTEWVELYNAGEESVDVSGWYLADEDGQTQPLPQGTTIDSKQAIVLIPGDSEGTADAFRAAWGDSVVVHALAGWSNRNGMSGLANKPTAENEVLTIRSTDGAVVDEVNFQASEPWPSGKVPGPSIYLLPTALTAAANDDGASWARSAADAHGARQATGTEVFDAKDVGSPGSVATE